MNDIYKNPIAMRVQGGTLPGDCDMCASCRNAIVRKGSMSGFSEVRCAALPNSPRVPEKMANCSMYIEKGKLGLYEMQEIAWIVEVKDKHIGFLSPEEIERRRSNQRPTTPRPAGF